MSSSHPLQEIVDDLKISFTQVKKQEWIAFALSLLIGALIGTGLSYNYLSHHTAQNSQQSEHSSGTD